MRDWMKRVGRVPGAGLLLLFLAAAATGAEPLRFAWLSDTHVGSSTAEADLRASIGDVNSLAGVSFVVLSGDVTEYGSLGQLRLARQILAESRVPVHVIPGNHDTKWSESGATDFARLWGADRFEFEAGGVRFIGMHQGPVMKMGDGHWAPQDVRWLEGVLARLPDPRQPIVFITHYPVDPGIANWFVVLDLLKQHNVQAVLCGHGHSNRKLSFEGLPAAMGRSNLRARNPAGGYNVVEIDAEKISFSERVPGAQTRPAWHSIPLRPRDGSADTNRYARPDFSVNERYPKVRTRWTHAAGSTIASTPAVWKDTAVFGDASGTVTALAIADGKVRWTVNAGGAVYSTPAASGDVLVLGVCDGSLRGIAAGSGVELWRKPTRRPVVASPAAAEGTVFIGSSEGKFWALEAATGKTKWEFAGVAGFVETRPLVWQGKVIFGAWDGHLYALDAERGELAWKWKGDREGTLFSPAACWPVAARGKVFVVAPDRMMTAIDAARGEAVWRSGKLDVRESIGLSGDGSRVYARTMNGRICALSTAAAEPEILWELNAGFGYDINAAMLVEKDGLVYYGTKNGLLLAVESATGKLAWQHKTGVALLNTVLPLNSGDVLATDADGKVRLVGARDDG